MASQQPPRRPSWKEKADNATPAAPTGPVRAWKDAPQGGQSEHQQRGMTRRTKFGIGLVTLLLLVGLLVWVILWLMPPRGATLVLVGSAYEDNLLLPHNLQGWQNLQHLSELTDESSRGALHGGHGPAVAERDPSLWIKDWKELKGDTVVLFLALHGGTDEKGAYLFLDDPNGQARLRMETVFDELQNGSLKNSNKLLILDATQLTSDWRTGQLQNDFAAQVKALAEDRKVKNLYVLMASGPGQRSWVSEDWQRTIFGHYVIEGLRGGADSNGEGNGDGRVNIRELENYVQKNVKAWVQANRDAVQVPEFLGDLGAAEKVELVQYKRPYAAPTPAARSLPKDELVNLWKSADRLHKQIPPPHAYAPDLWRQYLDTTMRLEQVIRAGDPTHKKEMLATKRAGLEAALTRSRSELWQSTSNALPMPDTLGVTPTWNARDVEAKRQEVAPGKEWMTQEAWALLLKWADGGPERNELNRVLLRVYLVKQLIQDHIDRKQLTGKELKDIQNWVKILYDGEQMPRPIESHFLVLLARDLPSPEPPRETLWKALDVRVKAEKAALGNVVPEKGEDVAELEKPRHLYSEYVWRWIEGEIKDADRLRQNGENLLIGSLKEDWAQAAADFTAAEATYFRARTNANIIREAVAIRDRVLCELPYYGQWLARQRTAPGTAGNLDARVKEFATLWKTVHELNLELEQVPAKDRDARQTQLTELQTRAGKVRSDFKTIIDPIHKAIDTTSTQADQQSDWHAITNLLDIPFIPPGRRYDLTDTVWKIAANFNGRPITATGQVKPEEATEEATARAQREGFLALALMGGVRLRKTADLPALVASGQWAKAGQQCQEQWLRLAEDAAQRSKASRDTGDLAVAYDHAREAEGSARLMDGAASVRLGLIQKKDRPTGGELDGPCQLARQLRLHDFLLWQVRRNGEEHWFELNPSDTPYYMVAGDGFYRDAVKLVKVQVEAIDTLRTESEKMKSARLAYALSKMNVIGNNSVPRDSSNAEIPWRLVPEVGVPAGLPMVWLKVSGQIKADPVFAERQAPKGAFGQQQYLTPISIEGNNPQNAATLAGRYRGQVLDTRIPLDNPATPLLIVNRYPLSPSAGLAIRADEQFTLGSIVIIIDASGSMATPVGGGKVRYDLALKALEDVLGKMPLGVPVYLWCFGDGLNGSSANQIPLGGGANWSPDALLKAARAMKERDKLRGNSPIASTMVKAMKDLEDAKGFRAMLVLTDGEDNVAEGGVDALLRQTFDKDENKDVFLNMVLFQSENPKAIKEQFKLVGERGGFTEASSEDLATKLSTLLVPKIELLGGAKKQDPVDVTFKGYDNLRWSTPLDPESYNLRLYNSSLRPGVTLARGDRLLTKLSNNGGRLELQRMLFAPYEQNRRSDSSVKVGTVRDNWQAGIIDYYYGGARDRAMRFLVTLEEASNLKPTSGSVKQLQPGFRWLEVKPTTGEEMGALSWWNDENYPAPTLGVAAERWPSKNGEVPPATLEMWWSGDHSTPRPRADFEFEINGTGEIKGAGGKPALEVDGQKYSLNVASEEREVMVTPDAREKRKCLVLRLMPVEGKGQRVWAQIKPATGTVRGEEHIYYSPSQKGAPGTGLYTAIFWDVDAAEALPIKLSLTSVDAFKKEAVDKGRYESFSMGKPGTKPSILPLRLEKKGDK